MLEKKGTKEEFINEHIHYPDIWPGGIENYPFTRSRILPIYYEIPEGAKVLDVGANSGEFMQLLKKKKGCDVTGADISDVVVEIAKKKGLNMVHVDAETLPFPDNTFDVVTLMETLEHFHEPIKYLKEISRVLKPGGYILGTCPHANLERYVHEDSRLHHQYYTEESLYKDLKEAFGDVHIKSLTGGQYSLGFINSHLASEPCELLFKAGKGKCEPWESIIQNTNDTRVWWGFTQLAGVVYYRMRGYAEKMGIHGIESGFEMFPYNGSESQMKWQERIHSGILQNELESILKVSDISIWQVMSSKWGVAFLQCAKDLIGKPIVTEVDDWLFDLPSYNIASHPFKPNSDMERMAYMQLELSDAIICSTQYIKDGLKKFFPNKPMYVVRNSIDFALWENTEIKAPDMYPKEEGVIRIGYTGCANHNGDLELIRRPLRKIVEKHPQVEFMCYQEFDALKGLPRAKYTNKWVTIDRYPDEIRRWNLDIGIAPLRDNDFNRSKSNLRWLEYSAMKIPTIASDVYPFTNSISHTNNGILVKNSDLDWFEALEELVLNQKKRLKIGEKSYQTVKNKFNMDKVSGEYAAILKEIKCNGVTSKQKLADSSEIQTMTVGASQP